VLENFTALDAVDVREAHTHVALLREIVLNLSGFRGTKTFMLRQFEGFAAFRAANSALPVDGSARASGERHQFVADDAIGMPVFGLEHLSVESASPLAVFRVLAPLFLIGAKRARFEEKRRAALFAFELDLGRLSFGAAFCLKIGEVARSAAELVRFTFVFDREEFLAVTADIYLGHYPLLFVRNKQYSDSGRFATEILAGAV
jgi:hypothetical protein